MGDVFDYLRSGGKLGYDHLRVDRAIDVVMKRYPTASKAYYEAVHQELAPLARELEMENEKLRSLLERALFQLGRWQNKYGEFHPDWLPPHGDWQIVRDADEVLTPNVQANRLDAAGGESSPQSGRG